MKIATAQSAWCGCFQRRARWRRSLQRYCRRAGEFAATDIGFGRPLRAFTHVSAKHAEWQAIDMEDGAPVVHDFSEANADCRAAGELAIGERGNVFEEPVWGA